MSHKRRLFRTLAASLIGSLAVPAVPALAGTMQVFDPNSAFDPTYPVGYNYWHVKAGERHDAVGQIDIYTGANLTYSGFGSGSLIRDLDGGGSMWVLTAGHVVDTATMLTVSFPGEEHYVNEDGTWFRTTHYETYVADEWYVPQAWPGAAEGDFFAGSDIALIKLTSTVENKTPYELIGADWEPNFNDGGDEFEAVGFGLTGDGTSGAVYYTGHRRAGANHLDFAFGSVLMSDFDPQSGAAGYMYEAFREDPDTDFPESMEYQIAGGDSGGPDLIGGVIAGVHSFGLGLDGLADASYLDLAGSTNVADWLAWIDAVISGNLSTSTGGKFLDPIFTSGGGGTVAEHRQRYSELLLEMLVEEGVVDLSQLVDAQTLLDINPSAEGFLLGTPYGNGPIPEPATGMLALAGAASLGLMRRRRH